MKGKQILFLLLGALALVASVAMYIIGSGSSHLSELKDFWWTTVPLGLLFIVLAFKKE